MHNIFHDLTIHSDVHQVFDAISSPMHLINWWPLRCAGKPELGAVYNFYFDEEFDWYGKVIRFEENRAFHIAMTKSDEDWENTSFGFDLVEIEEGKTKLEFWHKNWPKNNDHFRRSSFCWALLLNGLKGYVENKVIIPFEKRG